MDDYFNTAKAIGHLFEIAKIVNFIEESAPHTPIIMKDAKEVFDTIGTGVFGLEFETEIENEDLVEKLMDVLIELRSDVRKEKNWALSDLIRERLREIGVILEDRPDCTSWKIE